MMYGKRNQHGCWSEPVKSIDVILGCAFGKFGERKQKKARENRKIHTDFHQYLSALYQMQLKDRTLPSIGHNSTIRSENLRSKQRIKAKA